MGALRRTLGYDATDWAFDQAYLTALFSGPSPGATGAAVANLETLQQLDNPPAPSVPVSSVVSGNGLLLEGAPGLTAAEQAQIQDSVNRAIAAGYPQSVIDAMQAMANYQKAQAVSDTNAIVNSIQNSNYAQSPITGFFNSVFNPNAAPASASWTWLWWLAGGGLALWAVTR